VRSDPGSCVGPYAIAYRRAPVPGLCTRTRRDGSEDRLVKIWNAGRELRCDAVPVYLKGVPQLDSTSHSRRGFPRMEGGGLAPSLGPQSSLQHALRIAMLSVGDSLHLRIDSGLIRFAINQYPSADGFRRPLCARNNRTTQLILCEKTFDLKVFW